MHPIIFNHEKPVEDSSIELPLNNSIPPANVQMIAASRRSERFVILKFKDFNKFILSIKILMNNELSKI
jgi:hypothetical protein